MSSYSNTEALLILVDEAYYATMGVVYNRSNQKSADSHMGQETVRFSSFEHLENVSDAEVVAESLNLILAAKSKGLSCEVTTEGQVLVVRVVERPSAAISFYLRNKDMTPQIFSLLEEYAGG